jgi:Na+-transporting NADH:ubiquinone oxidoreductase subunit NqrC
MNSRRNKLNDYIRLNVVALCFGISVLVATISSAQQKAQQQASAQQKSAKLEQIAQYLSLTPQQKDKILPILADEAPKVRAIKDDPSLSRMQRAQRIKAIHQQNDPQMKAILSPEQYQKLQAMRHKSISDAYQ